MTASDHMPIPFKNNLASQGASTHESRIYLSVIGIERYGVLAIVFVVLGYFGLFNFGIGSAVTARIGALSKATAAERSETMWAAILLSFGFALVGCAAMVPVSWFLFHGIVSIDPALQHETETAVWWLIGAAPVIAISATFEGALSGREKFAALNAARILGSFLMQIVPLPIALAIAPSLTLLLPAALGAMCLLMKFSRVYPERPVLILAAPMALLGAATLVTLSGQSLTTPVLVGDSVLLAAAAGWAFRVFPKDTLVGLSIRPRRRSR